MKIRFFISILLATLAVGCKAQPSPTPTQLICPQPGNGVYHQLNAVGSATPPTTSPTYSVTSNSGENCFVVSGYLPAAGAVAPQFSQPSNVVGPSSAATVNLTVNCTATSATTCTGVEWIFSSAPAVAATAPATPAITSNVAANIQPAMPMPARKDFDRHKGRPGTPILVASK